MGTKANPGPYDCHADAETHEPIFTLRANDPLAPDLVREWARRHAVQKLIEGDLATNEQKCVQALTCAEDMESWRSGNLSSTPATARPKPQISAAVLVDVLQPNANRWTEVSLAGPCSGCSHMLEVGDQVLLLMPSEGFALHAKILCKKCGRKNDPLQQVPV